MLSGAVRAGKSVSGCQEGIKLSFKWNGNTGAIVRNALTELKRTTQDTFFRIFGCTSENIKFHPLVRSWNKQEQKLVFVNGSIVYFIGIENWSVLKSIELGWVFVDEGIEIKSSALKFLRTRLNKKMPYPDYDQYFFTATNPGDESHILYQWFIKIPETAEEIEERKKFWCNYTTSYDNIYLTDSYKAEIDSWKSDKEFHDRYAMGKWGRFKGLVYKEYEDDIYMVKPENYENFMNRILPNREIYTATDWGFQNPAAILFFGITGDGDVVLFDEIYETGKTNPDLRELYKNKSKFYGIEPEMNYCDPAEPSDIKEFTDNDIPSVKANNEIEAGIKKVKEYLRLKANGSPKFFIFERCIKTRREFGLYRRPDEDDVKVDKNVPEKPIDKDNHAMGCLRYFLMTHLNTAVLEYDGERRRRKY
jgi:phage terminase large subunit